MISFSDFLVWVTFHLSSIFLLGLPFIIFLWAIKKKNKVIKKLISNYWKISILFLISLILFIGKADFALLILNSSTILMTLCVWFWSDINSELREYRISNALIVITKTWRWALTLISLSFLILSFENLACNFSISLESCRNWLEPSNNLYILIKKLFNFLFGANLTAPIAKFFGLFGLLIYYIGLFQWLIIKLPRTGRNSQFSSYEDN